MTSRPSRVRQIAESATRLRDKLPVYDDLLTAYHAAFAPELERAVNELPLPAAGRVLDVPCGDGFYTAMLARRVGPAGHVVGVDLSAAYLDRANETVSAMGVRPPIEFLRSDVYELPFADATFDAAWCAQSLISLDDPVRVLRELRRVVRPGGIVAVLETDEFHHVLLPWPVELELVTQKAVQSACRKKYGRRTRLYPSRYLRRMLLEAGLKPRRKKTYVADRQPPFSPAVRRFLALHLRSLRELVGEHLTPEQRGMFDRFADHDSDECLYRRADAEVTCLNAVFVGER